MKVMSVKSFALSLLLLAFSGCSATVNSGTVATGGLVGTAAGAGTGAIIGSVISNGDVGASALLGAGIGLPVGLIMGAVYDYYSTDSVKERKLNEIQANQEEIFRRQRELDAYRDELSNDAPHGNPDADLREYNYGGPSLGNYYRN